MPALKKEGGTFFGSTTGNHLLRYHPCGGKSVSEIKCNSHHAPNGAFLLFLSFSIAHVGSQRFPFKREGYSAKIRGGSTGWCGVVGLTPRLRSFPDATVVRGRYATCSTNRRIGASQHVVLISTCADNTHTRQPHGTDRSAHAEPTSRVSRRASPKTISRYRAGTTGNSFLV